MWDTCCGSRKDLVFVIVLDDDEQAAKEKAEKIIPRILHAMAKPPDSRVYSKL
jgi:hypothetical protein